MAGYCYINNFHGVCTYTKDSGERVCVQHALSIFLDVLPMEIIKLSKRLAKKLNAIPNSRWVESEILYYYHNSKKIKTMNYIVVKEDITVDEFLNKNKGIYLLEVKLKKGYHSTVGYNGVNLDWLDARNAKVIRYIERTY